MRHALIMEEDGSIAYYFSLLTGGATRQGATARGAALHYHVLRSGRELCRRQQARMKRAPLARFLAFRPYTSAV